MCVKHLLACVFEQTNESSLYIQTQYAQSSCLFVSFLQCLLNINVWIRKCLSDVATTYTVPTPTECLPTPIKLRKAKINLL